MVTVRVGGRAGGAGIGEKDQTRVIARQDLRGRAAELRQMRSRRREVDHLIPISEQRLQFSRPNVLGPLAAAVKNGVAANDDDNLVRIQLRPAQISNLRGGRMKQGGDIDVSV